MKTVWLLLPFMVTVAGVSSAFAEELQEATGEIVTPSENVAAPQGAAAPAAASEVLPEAAPLPSSPVNTTPDTVPLIFTSRQPNLTLYIRKAGMIEPLVPFCMAPCDKTIVPGAYELAISAQEKATVSVPGQWTFEAPGAALEGRYSNRKGIRVTGIVLMSVFVAGGIAATALGAAWNIGDDGIGPFVAGLNCIALGLGLGLPFILQRPRAAVIYRGK